ncbi:MAG TPA: LytTR family DNA-binding domain-containing protein [Thermoanaerobaculia bacterium]|nr:LytTR family DNA-binding domain-containing protein [Thermoanaerobaculia bacterium]
MRARSKVQLSDVKSIATSAMASGVLDNERRPAPRQRPHPVSAPAAARGNPVAGGGAGGTPIEEGGHTALRPSVEIIAIQRGQSAQEWSRPAPPSWGEAGANGHEERGGGAAAPASWPARLILRPRGRMIILKEIDIGWIEAAGNYVKFNAGHEVHQVRGAIGDIEQLLDPAKFVRVHRSVIVNVEAVAEVIRGPFGDFVAVLRGGARVKVSRSHRRNLEAAIRGGGGR